MLFKRFDYILENIHIVSIPTLFYLKSDKPYKGPRLEEKGKKDGPVGKHAVPQGACWYMWDVG